jgi:hypothetical protein
LTLAFLAVAPQNPGEVMIHKTEFESMGSGGFASVSPRDGEALAKNWPNGEKSFILDFGPVV